MIQSGRAINTIKHTQCSRAAAFLLIASSSAPSILRSLLVGSVSVSVLEFFRWGRFDMKFILGIYYDGAKTDRGMWSTASVDILVISLCVVV
jgi:hypothetical protein